MCFCLQLLYSNGHIFFGELIHQFMMLLTHANTAVVLWTIHTELVTLQPIVLYLMYDCQSAWGFL